MTDDPLGQQLTDLKSSIQGLHLLLSSLVVEIKNGTLDMKGSLDATNASVASQVEAIKRASQASDSLGRKLVWLNLILAVATVVIALGTILSLFK